MNVRNGVLGLLLVLTMAFASVALYESTVRTSTTSTSTVTVTTTVTTSACPSGMSCAAFVASPKSDVQVDAVDANLSSYGTVTFWVTFDDKGDRPINFLNYALNYSVSANSTVLTQVACAQCFAGGTDLTASFWLQPRQTYTLGATFPSDKTFYYRLAQPGTVDVNINFTWTEAVAKPCQVAPCQSQVLPSNTTMIVSAFDFQAP